MIAAIHLRAFFTQSSCRFSHLSSFRSLIAQSSFSKPTRPQQSVYNGAIAGFLLGAFLKELGHDSSHDRDQEERANLESEIQLKIEAIDAWRTMFDDINNELAEIAIRSAIQIMTRHR
jgi:hypothetical protein